MNRSRIAIAGLLASLVVATAAPTLRADVPAAAPHIGVVNLREVYTQMEETKDTQTRLQGMQGELQTTQQAHQARLKDMQEKIGQYKPNTPQHEEAMNDFDEKSLEFAGDEKHKQVKMVREQNRQLKSAFDEIKAAVKDIATKKGLDIVLVNSGTDLPEGTGDIANTETEANLIFNRSVMYASDKADITQDVITALNAAYKAHGSGAPAPAPAPAK